MEPQKNKQDPKLVNSNDCYRFGTWNVRTLTGKDDNFIRHDERHDLRVLFSAQESPRATSLSVLEAGLSCCLGAHGKGIRNITH